MKISTNDIKFLRQLADDQDVASPARVRLGKIARRLDRMDFEARLSLPMVVLPLNRIIALAGACSGRRGFDFLRRELAEIIDVGDNPLPKDTNRPDTIEYRVRAPIEELVKLSKLGWLAPEDVLLAADGETPLLGEENDR